MPSWPLGRLVWLGFLFSAFPCGVEAELQDMRLRSIGCITAVLHRPDLVQLVQTLLNPKP